MVRSQTSAQVNWEGIAFSLDIRAEDCHLKWNEIHRMTHKTGTLTAGEIASIAELQPVAVEEGGSKNKSSYPQLSSGRWTALARKLNRDPKVLHALWIQHERNTTYV